MLNVKEQNISDINQYLNYCEQTRQNCKDTVSVRKNELHHLLCWAGETLLSDAQNMPISFPIFMSNLKDISSGNIFSPPFIKATLNVGRMFFNWARGAISERYGLIQITWIDSLRLPLFLKNQGLLVEHEYYTLDEIKKIATLTPPTITERRGIAAMAFLYLSGMRAGAFLTLPISCVDLKNLKIYQVPSMGVRTKFHKASVTTLLNIPELTEIVKAWDDEVRNQFSQEQTWFAPIQRFRDDAGHFHITGKVASPFRSKELRREMKNLCELADIPFRSAHKLRHGHAMFGIKNAQNIKELKAVSQNLMHSSISITDGIYGNLSGDDFTETISKIGIPQIQPPNENGITNDLIRALIKLQGNPALIQILLNN